MADNGQRRAPGEKQRAPESALHALHEHGVTFAVGIAVIELVGIAGPGYLGHFPADFRITHALTVAGRNFIEFRKLHDLAAWPVPAQIRGRLQRPAAR